MAARPRSTRTWKIVGAIAATTAALGGAAALPSAQAATVKQVTGSDAGGNFAAASDDADARCRAGGGEPTLHIVRTDLLADGTALVTIDCSYP